MLAERFANFRGNSCHYFVDIFRGMVIVHRFGDFPGCQAQVYQPGFYPVPYPGGLLQLAKA
jgi:hypothetical protein